MTDLLKLEHDYDRELDADIRGQIRNQFARKMIGLNDKRYQEFLDDLVQGRKGFDASADITAIGLDTASVLFTPASTKSILAGLSALTTAGKTGINKVYFYEQTLPVLINQMASNRRAVLADIQTSLFLEDGKYPLRMLVSDLNRYYEAGTIDGALESIQRQAAAVAKKAEEKMLEQAKKELQEASARQEAALVLVKQQASFEALKSKLSEWWIKLDSDMRWEQVDVIASTASARGVDIAPLLRDGDGGKIAHPDGFGVFLDSLSFESAAHQLLLADIAKHADGLEIE